MRAGLLPESPKGDRWSSVAWALFVAWTVIVLAAMIVAEVAIAVSDSSSPAELAPKPALIVSTLFLGLFVWCAGILLAVVLAFLGLYLARVASSLTQHRSWLPTSKPPSALERDDETR